MTVHSGEILGIAGVDGSGQRELFHALAGHNKPVVGKIDFGSREWTQASAADRLVDGLRLIPEDRHEEGIVDQWTLEENAVIGMRSTSPRRSAFRSPRRHRPSPGSSWRRRLRYRLPRRRCPRSHRHRRRTRTHPRRRSSWYRRSRTYFRQGHRRRGRGGTPRSRVSSRRSCRPRGRWARWACRRRTARPGVDPDGRCTW